MNRFENIFAYSIETESRPTLEDWFMFSLLFVFSIRYKNLANIKFTNLLRQHDIHPKVTRAIVLDI